MQSYIFFLEKGRCSDFRRIEPPFLLRLIFGVLLTLLISCEAQPEVPIPKPKAEFTASLTSVIVGESVTFLDQSTGENIDTWTWTFVGATPTNSSDRNPQVIYNEPGIHPVSLRVANESGSDTKTKSGFITVLRRTETANFQPSSITRKCPDHVEGDREFDGNGPRVDTWAELRIEGNNKIFVDYYLKARETRSDWTTAESSWSDLIWTAPSGTSILRVESDLRSNANYTDTDHQLDVPSIQGGNLVSRFEVMGDTGGNDVGNCTEDDVYLNIHFNPVSVLIQFD